MLGQHLLVLDAEDTKINKTLLRAPLVGKTDVGGMVP